MCISRKSEAAADIADLHKQRVKAAEHVLFDVLAVYGLFSNIEIMVNSFFYIDCVHFKTIF